MRHLVALAVGLAMLAVIFVGAVLASTFPLFGLILFILIVLIAAYLLGTIIVHPYL